MRLYGDQPTGPSAGFVVGNVDKSVLMSLYRSCVWFICWCVKTLKGNSEVWSFCFCLPLSVFTNLGWKRKKALEGRASWGVCRLQLWPQSGRAVRLLSMPRSAEWVNAG